MDLQSASRVDNAEAFSITRHEDTHVIEFVDLSPVTQSRLEIPYSVDEPSTMSISLRAELTYTTSKGTFQLCETLTVMIVLPISVNVQDVFQADGVFSRFTFGPSRPIPLIIKHCQLEESDNFEVLYGDTWNGRSIDTFPKQPVNWIVQTKWKSDQAATKVGKKQLQLDVKYYCYDEIILNTILRSFRANLAKTEYEIALRPLQAHLSSKLQNLWTETELEMCALTGEVEMWDYEALDWDPLLHAFNKLDRKNLEGIIRDWHGSLVESPLALQSDDVPDRVLRLGVDPPATRVVVTTEVKASAHTCIVGQAVLATVTISTRAFQPDSDVGDVEVSIEIPAPNQTASENWLVGGLRKASFPASQMEFQSTIYLLPQRTGSLLLPGVEVRCKTGDGTEAKPVAFETDHLSAAIAVQVRSAVESTTLGIGESEGIIEGHWLVSATKTQ